MKLTHKSFGYAAILGLTLAGSVPLAKAQTTSEPGKSSTGTTGTVQTNVGSEVSTTSITPSGTDQRPIFMATLVDAQLKDTSKLHDNAATVEVKVRGVDLVDPMLVNEVPNVGQAHLQYRVDNGPVIATTATRLSFQELDNGQHKISIRLAGNDSKPLGPEQVISVNVSGAAQGAGGSTGGVMNDTSSGTPVTSPNVGSDPSVSPSSKGVR